MGQIYNDKPDQRAPARTTRRGGGSSAFQRLPVLQCSFIPFRHTQWVVRCDGRSAQRQSSLLEAGPGRQGRYLVPEQSPAPWMDCADKEILLELERRSRVRWLLSKQRLHNIRPGWQARVESMCTEQKMAASRSQNDRLAFFAESHVSSFTTGISSSADAVARSSVHRSCLLGTVRCDRHLRVCREKLFADGYCPQRNY